MNSKNFKLWIIIGLSASLLAGLITGLLSVKLSSNQSYNDLARVLGEVSVKNSELEDTVVQAIKAADSSDLKTGSEILRKYGYKTDVINNKNSLNLIFQCITIWIIIYFFVTLITYFILRKIKNRISGLTNYLSSINSGDYKIISKQSEDDFSLLEDELCKTVVELKQTREYALKAQKSLADNMSDIAHQIKTPLTSLSLMSELLSESRKESDDQQYVQRIQKQLIRLENLVTTLLTLSRLDAGTLVFEKQRIDVFTLISTAVDAVEDITFNKKQTVNFIEKNDVYYFGDFNWSIEAIINIIKNCSEHTPEHGTINVWYEQNPIYSKIVIEDNGEGFVKEDIPHIFDRFYKGKNAGNNSTGIGLALSRAIIELQNGIIYAGNNESGGAAFTIKFYIH